MEAKFMEMLYSNYAANAAAAQAQTPAAAETVNGADGDQKMPANEGDVAMKEGMPANKGDVAMKEDDFGTDSNRGGQEPGAAGGSKAGGDISQTGKTGGASAGIK
jgi:hypothetical protein